MDAFIKGCSLYNFALFVFYFCFINTSTSSVLIEFECFYKQVIILFVLKRVLNNKNRRVFRDVCNY